MQVSAFTQRITPHLNCCRNTNLSLTILTFLTLVRKRRYWKEISSNLPHSKSNETNITFNAYRRIRKQNKNGQIHRRRSSKLCLHSAKIKTLWNSDQTETTTYSPETDSNEIRRIAQNKLSVWTAFSSSTRKLHRSTQLHRHGLRLLIIATAKLAMSWRWLCVNCSR